MAQTTVADRVTELIDPVLKEFNLELVDVEYQHEGAYWFLRLFIDKEGGVNLDDCARLSREIDPLLEVEGVIPHAYRLEVSSPGLDRPLKRPEHFIRFEGEWIKVKTRELLDPDQRGFGRKTFSGILVKADDQKFRIAFQDKRGGEGEFSYDQLSAANLDPQF